jgi:hypothetical protein
MIPQLPAGVGDEEDLARYVFRTEHVRPDGTIKPDALMPYRHTDLSVTRHHGLADSEIWAAGQRVGQQRQLQLVGRADLLAADYRARHLTVQADATDDNAHHALVLGWPAEKPAQKSVAQLLVAQTRYRAAPAAGR